MSRGEVLDSDILKHSELIPDELARQLLTLRDGEVVRRVGDKIVRALDGNGAVTVGSSLFRYVRYLRLTIYECTV